MLTLSHRWGVRGGASRRKAGAGCRQQLGRHAAAGGWVHPGKPRALPCLGVHSIAELLLHQGSACGCMKTLRTCRSVSFAVALMHVLGASCTQTHETHWRPVNRRSCLQMSWTSSSSSSSLSRVGQTTACATGTVCCSLVCCAFSQHCAGSCHGLMSQALCTPWLRCMHGQRARRRALPWLRCMHGLRAAAHMGLRRTCTGCLGRPSRARTTRRSFVVKMCVVVYSSPGRCCHASRVQFCCMWARRTPPASPLPSVWRRWQHLPGADRSLSRVGADRAQSCAGAAACYCCCKRAASGPVLAGSALCVCGGGGVRCCGLDPSELVGPLFAVAL